MIREERVRAALEFLPKEGFLYNYVLAASEVNDSPLAYHVGAGLCILAMVAHQDLCARLGNEIYSNIFVLNVGDSAKARKSAAITMARGLLESAFPPVKKEAPLVLEQPGSPEGLLDALRKHKQHLICYPEFGSFLQMTESGTYGALRTKYTELWDGTPVGRMLKGGNSETIYGPRLSLIGGCTVSYLEDHTLTRDWEGGFMGRFLMLFAARERTIRHADQPLPKRAVLVERLRELRKPLAAEEDGNALATIGDWHSTPESRALIDQWYETKLAVAESIARGAAQSSVNRAHSQFYKIALLLSWDRGIARTLMPWGFHPNDAKFALEVATWHMLSAVRVTENLASSYDMRDRRKVLRTIQAEPTAIGQISEKSEMLLRRLRGVIETLLIQGMIMRVSMPGGESGEFYQLSERALQSGLGRGVKSSASNASKDEGPARSSSSSGVNGAAALGAASGKVAIESE